MKIWIEVTNGNWAWEEKIEADISKFKRGLKAPASKKYYNLFEKLSPNDIVLTYLSNSLTQNHNWKSSIVGISKIKNSYQKTNNTIRFDTYDDIELPIPIKYKEFKEIEEKSDLIKYAFRLNLQKYLFEITIKDFFQILKLHKENFIFLDSRNYLDESNH